MINRIIQELKDCYKFRYVVFSFVQTNLKLRYRRSFLGFIWTVLAPLLHYVVMGVIFTIVIKNNIPNFFTYYFTGAVFFVVISNIVNRSTTVLIGNEHFIKKIYLPKFVFNLNIVGLEVTNFLLTFSTLFLLGNIFGKLEVSWTVLLVPAALLLTVLFLLGVSILVGIATVYFRDMQNIVPVVTQALLFFTPIFYEPSQIPEKMRWFFNLNPINPFLSLFRSAVFYNTWPEVHTWVFCSVVSLGSLLVGLLALKYFDNKIIFKL